MPYIKNTTTRSIIKMDKNEHYFNSLEIRAFAGVFVFTGLDYWTGLLDWTTGLTLELTFELFFLPLIINIRDIAVVLLAKVNLGVLGK